MKYKKHFYILHLPSFINIKNMIVVFFFIKYIGPHAEIKLTISEDKFLYFVWKLIIFQSYEIFLSHKNLHSFLNILNCYQAYSPVKYCSIAMLFPQQYIWGISQRLSW